MRFILVLITFYIFLTGVTSWAGTITGLVDFLGKPKGQAAVVLEVVTNKIVPPPKEHGVMVQKNQRFIPRVLPVLKGSIVDFPNKDTVFHNAFSLSSENPFYLESYGPGEKPNVKFDKTGKVDVFCNFHSQMEAVILVVDHPYFALTNQKGEFEINNIPAGSYRIKAWATPDHTEEKLLIVEDSNTVIIDFEITKKP